MSTYPGVYPSEIKYRPGRIQSLTPDQEIVLKQSWAVLLKYWGYGVEISTADIHSTNAFVASSVTLSLSRSETNVSSVSLQKLKKKKSFFSRKHKAAEAPAQISTKRANQVENGHLETYARVDEVSDRTRHIFLDHYKEGAHHEEVEIDEDDSGSSDSASIESFVTASSTFATLEEGEQHIDEKQGNETVRATAHYEVKPHRDIFPFTRQYDPKLLHNSLMKFPRNDLMDNLLLRYVRARKYVLPDIIKMFTSSLDWKVKGYKVNDLLAAGDAPAYVYGTSKGFVKNFTTSKSVIRGHDKNNNPLFIFQSRKHFASDSPLAETEQFALVIIEWCRLFLREVNESVDTCSIMFDLTGFSMKNADNAPVKFLTQMFEAHYPECLGIVIIHNAPWIFSTVWNIIKNWLDPVVASKIHFTKGFDDLNTLIDAKHIPAELGGKDDADTSYDNPTKEHTTPKLAKDARYRQLREERDELHMRFLETTIKWVESTNPEVSSQYLKDKIYLSYQLSDNYIALDPYLRNPGIYDRNGTLNLRN